MKATTRTGLVISALLLLSTSRGDSAENRDGNQLLDWCTVAVAHIRDDGRGITDINDVLRYTRCLTYLEGYTDASPLCVSAISSGQLARVVSKFLNDHPERLNESMGKLTGEALGKAFPCKP